MLTQVTEHKEVEEAGSTVQIYEIRTALSLFFKVKYFKSHHHATYSHIIIEQTMSLVEFILLIYWGELLWCHFTSAKENYTITNAWWIVLSQLSHGQKHHPSTIITCTIKFKQISFISSIST